MNKNKCFNFLNIITEDIKNVNNPIIIYNNYYIDYWNTNKSNIELLIKIFYNQIISIINITNDTILEKSLIKHIIWTPIIHKYPIYYEYYINNNNNINYDNFNNKINTKEITSKYNINYKSYIKKYVDNIPNNIIDILNEFQNGLFISLDIKLYVENYINNCIVYNFDHLDLYFFYNTNELNNQTKNNLIYNIYIISKWIYNFNPNKKIIFYYFDTTIEKKIIKNINYLCNQNINSGLSSTNYLMIWRREEILKVLIHELIHFTNIDFKHNKQLDTIIKYNIGKFNYPILINETITELQAQFYHTLYLLIIENTNKSLCEIIYLFKIFYNIEHIYSWYQFNKIMNYFSINSFNMNLIKLNFHQSTNVFSYFILKSIFSIHFYDILYELNYIKKLINDNNQSLIIPKIKNIIDNFPIVFLNKIIQNININNDSLRMSIFGNY